MRLSTHGVGFRVLAAPVQLAAGTPLRSTVIVESSVPAGIAEPSISNVSVIGFATVPTSGVLVPGSVAAMSSCWPNTAYPFSLFVLAGSLVMVTVPASGSVASATTGSDADGVAPGLELTVPPGGTEPCEALVGELGDTIQVTDGGFGSQSRLRRPGPRTCAGRWPVCRSRTGTCRPQKRRSRACIRTSPQRSLT